MTHNQFWDFYCPYTIIQAIHTEFKKVPLTEYSAFKSSIKMIQEQAVAAVITALISEFNNSRRKRKKEESVWNLDLKEEKIYKTFLAKLQL